MEEVAWNKTVVLMKKLTVDEPNNRSFRIDLGIALQTLGNVLRKLARREEALASYRSELEVFEKLLTEQPTNLDWLAHLSSACFLHG